MKLQLDVELANWSIILTLSTWWNWGLFNIWTILKNITLTCYREWGVWLKMEHRCHSFNFFSGGLGLIGNPLALYWYTFLRRNQFSLHQNYVWYLEYFWEGNGLFRGAMLCFWLKYWTTIVTFSKNVFYLLKTTNIGVDGFKNKCKL